jgi:hypothetical protein
LIIELIREHVGDSADTWQIPQHIKTWTSEKKVAWILGQLAPVVDLLYVPIQQDASNISTSSDFVTVLIDGCEYKVLMERNIDELHDSSLAFTRIMVDFMNFDDVILCIPSILKRFAVFFVGLTSYHSKYAMECINLLTKLEWVLSEREKMKVLLRSLVNPAGRLACNKPADMQQENNIKMVKHVFRGLGAGKLSDQALIRASQAAPAVGERATNFLDSFKIDVPATCYSHTKKKDDLDAQRVRDVLQAEKPFTPGRSRQVGERSVVEVGGATGDHLTEAISAAGDEHSVAGEVVTSDSL